MRIISINMDRLIRALSYNEEWLATAIDATEAVEEARKLRHYGKQSSTFIGQIMLLAGMMASQLKEDRHELSVTAQSLDGEAHLIATANPEIALKAYAKNPEEENYARDGVLTIIKDLGLKTPYNSTVQCRLDDLAGGVALYFTQSEQIPTYVRLCVSFNDDGSIRRAFGFMAQALPFASGATKKMVEEAFNNMPANEALLFRDASLEDIIAKLFSTLGEAKTAEKKVFWRCGCSKEKAEATLASLGEEELNGMIAEGKTVSIECGFCGKTYYFRVDELERIRDSIAKKASLA